MIWHIITPEYPPQPGGVSDYTQMVASGLASVGDDVHVWSPSEQGSGARGQGSEVTVHRELGLFKRSDLRRASRMLDQFKGPRRLLVQWVPHGYGYRSMNFHVCFWLWRRARQGDRVEIMVHEPFLSFAEGSSKQTGVAVVHRLMTMILLRAATRVWMTIPAWERFWRPYALGRSIEFTWLPVASNIPVVDNPDGGRAIRARYGINGEPVLGHFGTCDRHITSLLLRAVPALMKNGKPHTMLLLGRGSEKMRDELVQQHPEIGNRVRATGELDAADLSLHLSACDLMLQPYADGVSSRRTSTMVALAHGVPIVTTSGRLTEPFWAESQAVAMVPVEDLQALVEQTQQLLSDAVEKRRLGAAARSLYSERFDAKLIVAALRGDLA